MSQTTVPSTLAEIIHDTGHIQSEYLFPFLYFMPDDIMVYVTLPDQDEVLYTTAQYTVSSEASQAIHSAFTGGLVTLTTPVAARVRILRCTIPFRITDFNINGVAPQDLNDQFDRYHAALIDFGFKLKDNNTFTQEAFDKACEAIEEAGRAIAAAAAAQGTADDAISRSNTAVDTAESAVDTAESAVSASNTAVSVAENAVITSDSARLLSESAVSISENAVRIAESGVRTSENAVRLAQDAVVNTEEAVSISKEALHEIQGAAEEARRAVFSSANIASANIGVLLGEDNSDNTYILI